MRRSSASGILRAILSVALIAALSGCVVHAVNQFYSPDSIADMPSLYGKWVLKESKIDDGKNQEWTFAADRITLPDLKGTSSALVSKFFRVDDMLFLDAVADSPPEVLSFWWVAHITPVHTVSRVIADDKTMKIIPLDPDWMENAVKSRTVSLPSVWHQEQKSYLFTATPAEWTEFLKKYGKDTKAFPEEGKMVFTRNP